MTPLWLVARTANVTCIRATAAHPNKNFKLHVSCDCLARLLRKVPLTPGRLLEQDQTTTIRCEARWMDVAILEECYPTPFKNNKCNGCCHFGPFHNRLNMKIGCLPRALNLYWVCHKPVHGLWTASAEAQLQKSCKCRLGETWAGNSRSLCPKP